MCVPDTVKKSLMKKRITKLLVFKVLSIKLFRFNYKNDKRTICSILIKITHPKRFFFQQKNAVFFSSNKNLKARIFVSQNVEHS